MNPNNYKILFCGFNFSGYRALLALLDQGYEVVEVWTSADPEDPFPDYKSVAQLAQSKGIKIFIGNPNKHFTADDISDLGIDLFVAVNYKYIISKHLYESAKFKGINLHGSLLPAYRGGCPNVWNIINGEKVAGATVHVMEESVDSGDIILQEKVNISDDETGYSLLLKLINFYPKLLVDALNLYLSENFIPLKQDDTKISFFPMRKPEDGLIDFNWGAIRINNWIRALTKPYPGAYFYFKGFKVVVYQSLLCNRLNLSDSGADVGEIVEVETSNIVVKTGDGYIKLLNLEEFDFEFEKGSVLNVQSCL